MAFNRDRNSRSGGDRGGFRSRPSFGGGGRPRFGSSGDRGPVEMHDAICDNCGKSCQVPFRPTQGKPVYCSNCFENQRGGSDRYSEARGPERSEDRPMFNAICADCGNSCKVPFQPSGDKPVFCSNCFGDKKNAGGKDGNSSAMQSKIEELSAKVDKILSLLSLAAESEEVITEVVEKPVKKAKKKLSVKKSPVTKS